MTPEAIRREIHDEMLDRRFAMSAAERVASWERELVLWEQLDTAIRPAFDLAVSYAVQYAVEQVRVWRGYADEDAAAGVSS